MKKISLVAVLILIALQFSCKKEGEMVLKIQSFIGDVKILNESGVVNAEIGQSLRLNETIQTGPQAIADLTLGKTGLIRVNQNSTVTIASLVGKPADDTELNMEEGKLFVTMSKLKKGEFKVNTATAVIAVRGTSFRVTSSREKARLDVVAGTVKVKPVKDGEVIEDVEETVEVNETVEIDEQSVADIVEKKKDINIMKLKQEEIKMIRDEVKDIRLDIVEKLDKEARQEFKEKIIEKKNEIKEKKDGREDAKQQMMMQQAQKQQQLKAGQQKAEAARQAEIRKQQENQARIEREKKKKEKERRDRASNIPTL